jgi:hypothetical protein
MDANHNPEAQTKMIKLTQEIIYKSERIINVINVNNYIGMMRL